MKIYYLLPIKYILKLSIPIPFLLPLVIFLIPVLNSLAILIIPFLYFLVIPFFLFLISPNIMPIPILTVTGVLVTGPSIPSLSSPSGLCLLP